MEYLRHQLKGLRILDGYDLLHRKDFDPFMKHLDMRSVS